MNIFKLFPAKNLKLPVFSNSISVKTNNENPIKE